jgi:7-cyano-7-deazaguanine synthase in queuosine biosynthesis
MKEWKPLAARFYFDSFRINAEKGLVTYVYTTDAGHLFTHELSFGFPKRTDVSSLAPAAFALGMAELAHFWKAILAPEIVIRAGKLSSEQIAFWENLYTKGLGEFFYVNQIDFRNLVHITNDAGAPAISPTESALQKRALVPLGGGKDSLVTGELLKKQEKEFSWFELEPLPFAKELRAISRNGEYISVGRNVAKNFAPVIELVKKGAPNGHVPITATYMLSAVLAAKIDGFSDVVMSLEQSAEEGNVEYLGMSVNHQYSKSFEFEKMMHEYVQRHIDPNVRLFSLLRPLYEIEIVQEFVKYPQYFEHFVSCNRGLKSGTWCGACAKCAFMFAALSAFLPSRTVVGIFKKSLFEDESLVPLYEELVGMHTAKPFDCVGTYEENLLALYLSGKRYKESDVPLPPVLARLPIAKGEAYLPLLAARGESIIPPDYQKP